MCFFVYMCVGVCVCVCVCVTVFFMYMLECFCVYVCKYVCMYVYICIWILTKTHYNICDLVRFSNSGLLCIDSASALKFTD